MNKYNPCTYNINLYFVQLQGPVSFSGADRIGISAFYQIQGEIIYTLF